MVSAMIDGRFLLALGLLGSEGWARLGFVFCMRLNFRILYFTLFHKKGGGVSMISQIYIVCYDILNLFFRILHF